MPANQQILDAGLEDILLVDGRWVAGEAGLLQVRGLD